MMLIPNSILILLSRYQTMYSSSMPMNPSIETPAKPRLWKNSCLGVFSQVGVSDRGGDVFLDSPTGRRTPWGIPTATAITGGPDDWSS